MSAITAVGHVPFALALLVGTSCGSDRGDPVQQDCVRTTLSVNVDPETRIELVFDPYAEVEVGDGPAIVVGSDGGGRALPRSVSVRGRLLDLSGDELRIGECSYGSLGGPAHILIHRAGVFVNGELRGELEP